MESFVQSRLTCEVVPLTFDHLDALLLDVPALSDSVISGDLQRAYFSLGSVAYCLLADGVPVFAGGVVNLQWKRGEAWILPTPFFRKHLKVCLRSIRNHLPGIASFYRFNRIQATCIEGVSAKLFLHLGFTYEGTMKRFGPNGETCDMYSRIFDGMMERT